MSKKFFRSVTTILCVLILGTVLVSCGGSSGGSSGSSSTAQSGTVEGSGE